MENKYKRGSEWRKWDLHLHTKYTHLNNLYTSISEDEYIKKIIDSGISVVGLTNYFNFSKEDYALKSKLEDKGITVFLNLELRLTYQNKEDQCCDIHIIFDNDLDITVIDSFLNNLDVKIDGDEKKAKVLQTEADYTNATVEFETLLDILNKPAQGLRNHYLIGFLSRGHGNGRTSTQYEQLAKKCHFLIHSSDNSRNITDDRIFWLSYGKPLLQSSDAHSIDKIGTKYTWIKADTTFEGLKQILFEPSERTKIQQLKPDDKSGYQVIDSIELKEGSFWNNKILLNENLNVIIGGRSTGKSNLLASIAYKINDKINFEKDNDRSFIKEHINGITINWKDNAQNDSRDIQFLPQGYMYDIAFDEAKFNALIANIIKNNEQYTHIEQYIESNNSLKKLISQKLLEVFQNQDDLNNLKNKLNEMGDKKGIENEIEVLKEKSNELSKTEEITQEILDKYQSFLNNLTDNTNKINIINNDIQILKEIIGKDILSNEYLYTFNDLSENTKNILTNQYNIFSNTIKKQWEDCMKNIIDDQEKIKETLEANVKKIQNDNDFRKGQEYYATNSELKSIQDKMNAENIKLQKYSDIETKYTNVVKRRDNLIKEIVEEHCKYKTNIDTLCNTFQIEHNNITIKVKTQSLNKDLSDFLKDRLNLRSSVGEKYIVDFAEHYEYDSAKLKDILQKTLQKEVVCKNNNDPQSVITELLTRSWYSYTFNLDYQNDSFSEMSQGKKAFVILNLLLEFDTRECPILIDQPEDSLDNRAIYKELVEYIKKQKIKRQIIVATHNPNIVVGADAENVIVANQNGINSQNENNIKFQYINGSLENTQNRDDSNPFILASQGIREHICDILEGGEDAFEKREKKYGFK